MRSTYHKFRQAALTTKECKQIINSDCSKTVKQQFASLQLQDLADKCQNSIQQDLAKKNHIQDRLFTKFFTVSKKRNRKAQLLKKFSTIPTLNNDSNIRSKLEKKIKNQLSLVYRNSSCPPKSPTFTRQGSRNGSPLGFLTSRPFTSSSKYTIQKTPSKKELYCSKIDNLIQQSHKVKKFRHFKTHKAKSMGKVNNPELKDKIQQCLIMDKIITKDVDAMISTARSNSLDCNPEKNRKKQQEETWNKLSNFEKYNMTFYKFMKQKTFSNIQRSIYHDKIRKKDSYVQKFQKQVLDDFKFSDQVRQKLENVFYGIESQYKGYLKRTGKTKKDQ